MPVVTNGNASFKVSSTVIAEVSTASFSLTRQSIDTTPLGNTHRHHEPGMLEGTATIELFLNATDHGALIGNMGSGTLLNEAEIVWESGCSVKGKALIQDFSSTLAPNGVAMATLTLQFTQNAITVDVTP